MKEVGRRCQRCQFGWYATSAGQAPAKPRWFDEAGSFWTDGQARMSRRVANYERHQQQKARFDECPNCGSKSVLTDKTASFQPTGAIAPVVGPPSVDASSRSASSASRTGSPQPPNAIWEQVKKLHAQHWRIIWAVVFSLAPFGSLGDETVYTGGAGANALHFLVILVISWVVAAFFFTLHLRRRQAK